MDAGGSAGTTSWASDGRTTRAGASRGRSASRRNCAGTRTRSSTRRSSRICGCRFDRRRRMERTGGGGATGWGSRRPRMAGALNIMYPARVDTRRRVPGTTRSSPRGTAQRIRYTPGRRNTRRGRIRCRVASLSCTCGSVRSGRSAVPAASPSFARGRSAAAASPRRPRGRSPGRGGAAIRPVAARDGEQLVRELRVVREQELLRRDWEFFRDVARVPESREVPAREGPPGAAASTADRPRTIQAAAAASP